MLNTRASPVFLVATAFLAGAPLGVEALTLDATNSNWNSTDRKFKVNYACNMLLYGILGTKCQTFLDDGTGWVPIERVAKLDFYIVYDYSGDGNYDFDDALKVAHREQCANGTVCGHYAYITGT